jgi:hypothetical protein
MSGKTRFNFQWHRTQTNQIRELNCSVLTRKCGNILRYLYHLQQFILLLLTIANRSIKIKNKQIKVGVGKGIYKKRREN